MGRRIAVGLLMMCALGIAADLDAAPKWTRVVSKNFLLVGDASERDIRQVATRLEQFRETLSRVLPRASVTAPEPTVVVVFANERSFRPYKPLYQGKPITVTGYFQGGPDANYIALTLERGEAAYPVIFHEYTHLMLHRVLRSPPMWLGEGLAEYYSTFALSRDGKKAEIGKPIARHIALLRDRFIPLAELLAVDRASPLINDAQRRGVFYAESWAWVHFLVMGRQDRTAELAELVDKLAAGVKVDEAFRAVLGSDPASFEGHLLNYVRQVAYQFTIITLREAVRDEKEMIAVPISDAEWQAHLGDLLAHMGRLDEAEQRIEAARTLDQKLALTHASLGVVRIRQSRSEEAVELWRQAMALESTGFGAELARQWLERVRPTRVPPQAGHRAAAVQPSARSAEGDERRQESLPGQRLATPEEILVLRGVRPGEVRDEGDLAQIDCRAAGIVFTLTTGDREIRVIARTFADVDIVSFRGDKPGAISCGPRRPGDRACVTWLPFAPGEKPPAAGIVGKAVAVEFLPIK